MAYRVFHRTWYDAKGNPQAGRKTTISARVETAEEARSICRVWNANHEPGARSRRAEFESR